MSPAEPEGQPPPPAAPPAPSSQPTSPLGPSLVALIFGVTAVRARSSRGFSRMLLTALRQILEISRSRLRTPASRV